MNKPLPFLLLLFLLLFLGCNSNTTETQDNIENKKNKIDAINSEDNSLTDSSKTVLSEKENNATSKNYHPKKEATTFENPETIVEKEDVTAEKIIESPLKVLFKYGEIGRTYTKKELIEHYNFPKESLGFVKNVTYTGQNTLYFKWGSTWLIEKVSDAKFQNGPMTFDFKKDKTIIKGGAIGIKYNKKIYTELIIKNGNAYIPNVKGFYWEIKK
ncbi:hypothetical protein [Flavobacterium sp. TSSA_36]|uniref:hypothetical protein n=1 Tax=Flavobacterium sp. TSSA_36 TaxID=3447669 RepID=UPI003F3A7CE1